MGWTEPKYIRYLKSLKSFLFAMLFSWIRRRFTELNLIHYLVSLYANIFQSHSIVTKGTVLSIVINHHSNLFLSRSIHYSDVIMGAIAAQITSFTIVYSTVYSDADQRKHHSLTSLAFVRGIHRGPVNSPQKWPVTRKIFPFDDVIMFCKLPQNRHPYLTWEN